MKIATYAVAKGEQLMKERADLNLNTTKIAFNIHAAAESPSVGIRVMNRR